MAYENELEKRKLVIQTGLDMQKTNLVQGTWGNMSMRLDKDHMVITPSGISYEDLKPEDLPIVNIHTLEWTGPLKPSHEKGLHSELYKLRDNVQAVLHSHPIYCSVLASCRVEMPVINDEMREYVNGSIKTATYGAPGSKAMTLNSMKAMTDRNGAFIANHGAVACGESMEIAFKTMEVMENSSKQFIEQSACEILGINDFLPELTHKIFKQKMKDK